jgi:hypothetical protein
MPEKTEGSERAERQSRHVVDIVSGRDVTEPVESRRDRACGLSLPIGLVIAGNRFRGRTAAAGFVGAGGPTQAGIHDIPSADAISGDFYRLPPRTTANALPADGSRWFAGG